MIVLLYVLATVAIIILVGAGMGYYLASVQPSRPSPTESPPEDKTA